MWFYVQGSEKVGPVSQEELEALFKNQTLNDQSYVWTKGFENWERLAEVNELKHLLNAPEPVTSEPDTPSFGETSFSDPDEEIEDIPMIQNAPPLIKEFDWNSVSEDHKIFHIKIGQDRGADEREYGPYSIKQLRKAYNESRINEKTYIFTTGLENWMYLIDAPIFETICGGLPPAVQDVDRRRDPRKPFVARLFFHDENELYEGICRDVSIGGLQILVATNNREVGDVITMNVHPENTDFCFTAKGEIVRLLDGNQGFSLRFVDLSDQAKGSIDKYITNNS
ncbi:MAG: DUF4339 domain-containing protein [Oligoflexia bacterium]|nr:DUF4339 domain-containing protein [Oligoflexia bacterium]